MCGIFGSDNFNKFEELYKLNTDRGNFSHGFLFVNKKDRVYIRKGPGVHDLKTEKDWINTSRYKMYLGHTQAPTSTERQYKDSTTHPFINEKFIIAHNGVLENYQDLCDKHYVKTPRVDSQAIASLLDELYVGDDICTIAELFSQLTGTFACWLYSKITSRCYLVRSGSTLFFNKDRTNFSSTQSKEMSIEANEGVIYQYTIEGYTTVGSFSSNSAFFM